MHLALALTFAAPGVGHHNAPTGSRWFAIGGAARNGLLAARAARAGLTSDVNFLTAASSAPCSVSCPKPACADRRSRASRQSCRKFRSSPGVRRARPWRRRRRYTRSSTAVLWPPTSRQSRLSVPPPFLKMVDHGIVGGRIARLTSQPYQMAIAAVARDLAFDVGQMGDVPVDVLQLMNKITVRPNEDLLDGFPRQWAAGLHVRTTNSEHRRLIRNIPGDPRAPLRRERNQDQGFPSDRIHGRRPRWSVPVHVRRADDARATHRLRR